MGLIKDVVGGGISSNSALALNGTVATALTATGTNQATGLAMTNSVNVFGTVAASTAAVLPVGSLSDDVWVRNGGANALSVFPPVGGTINALSANAALSVAAGKDAQLKCVSASGLTWIALVGA